MDNKEIIILAIDDNLDNLITIQALTSEAFPNAKIIMALNGKEGLELAASENPDVILLDIIMPEMDGFEVCQRLKSNQHLCDIPVVFVTALKGDKESRIRGLEVGAEAFLAKPIDESELVAQIRAMVKIRNINIEKQSENERLSIIVEEKTREIKATHIATLNLLEDLQKEIAARRLTEKALSESEAIYRSVIQASPDNITVTDLRGNIRMISPKGVELIGYESEEFFIGKNINDFLIDKDRAQKNIEDMFLGVFNGPEEYRVVKVDKTEVHTEINAEFVRNADGTPNGFVFAIRDITDRKIAEKAIYESEEKYRLLIENSPNGIAIYQEGKFVYVNRAGLEMFGGIIPSDLIGKQVLSIVHPDSIQAVTKRILQVSAGGQVPPMEEKLIKADGSVFYAEVVALGIIFNGKSAGQVIVTNITERRKAETLLKESEEKYRFMTENTGDVLWHMDYNFCFDYVSPAIERMQGYKPEELIGRPMFSLLNPKGIRHIEEQVSKVKSKMEAGNLDPEMKFEYESVCKDGSWIWVEVNVTIQLDNEIKPVGFHGVTRDITDRKHFENALRESEEKFRHMANLLPQVVFEMKLTGEITYVNQHAKTLFGYEIDELVGKNSLIAHIPEERERVIESIHKKLAGGQISNKEFKMLRKDGTVFPAILSINLIIKDNNPIGLRGVVVDITEQKLIEQKIRESEEKYRDLMENSPQGIMIYVEGKIAYINKAALRLMRANHKEELMGKTIIDFIHPKNQELVLERMKLVALAPINSILPSVEEKYIRMDGTEVDVEIIVMPILFEGKPAVQMAGHDISDRKKAESELEKNRTELKAIYDNAPVMMCVINENREIQFANKAFTDFTGFIDNADNNEVLGNIVGCIHAFENKKGCGFGESCIICPLRIAIETTHISLNGVKDIEYTSTVLKKGIQTEVHLLGSTALINALDNKNILICLHDITDRKSAEKALQKSETLLRTFIDNSPFEIWARDKESIGILENKKLVNHYGSIIGYTPTTDPRIDQETLQLWEKNNARVFAGEIIDEEYEFKVYGENRIFQQIAFPIKNEESTIGIAGFNIDITDKKLIEQALYENNLRLELAMEISDMAWWEMDVDSGHVFFGRRKTEMLGYEAEDFSHYSDFMKLVHPDDSEPVMTAMKNHIYNKSPKYEIEYRIKTISGDYKWFFDTGFVSKQDKAGKPLIVSGLVVDITKRKRSENDLYNQKQFFEQMFMQSSLSTQILDKNGWCERINPKLTQIFGVEASKMEGQVYNIFKDEEIKQKGIIPKLEKVYNEKQTVEWEVLFDIGVAAESQNVMVNERKKVWYSNWAYPILDQNGELNHVIIQHNDITDRKVAQEALLESQIQLKKFAAHLQNVREEERVMLAREIHDDLGQILVAIKIDLGLLKQSTQKKDELDYAKDIAPKFDNLYLLVDNTLKSARRIMTDLRPEVLDLLGFTETVKQHLKNFEDRYNIACSFKNNVNSVELAPPQAVALFRIVQEALNNIAKHSKASELKVLLNENNQKIILEIVDNGVGFDYNKAKRVDSYGLMGMKERVFLLDGELTICSKKGTGTSVKVAMPYLK